MWSEILFQGRVMVAHAVTSYVTRRQEDHQKYQVSLGYIA